MADARFGTHSRDERLPLRPFPSPPAFVRIRRVTKLCIFAGTMVGGYVGGYLCSSLGLMTEVIASGIGSMVGVYLGWKLAQRIER
jgi:hypothetical protein